MRDSDYLTPDERDDMAVLSNINHGLGPLHVADLIASHAVADDLLREARTALRCTLGGPSPRIWNCPCPMCIAARRIDAVLNPEPASECARCRSWGAEPLADGRSWQDCPDCNGTGKKEDTDA